MLLLCGATAWPKGSTLVVTDLFGDVDVRDEAAALSLVIQSALDSKAVPRRRLADAVTKVSGRPARYALVVEADKRAELRQQLGADVLLWGTVQRRGTQLTAALHASPKGGDEKLVGSATLAAGRLVELGVDLAQRAAKALDLPTPALVTTVGYGQIYPYVQRQRLSSPTGIRGRPAPSRSPTRGPPRVCLLCARSDSKGLTRSRWASRTVSCVRWPLGTRSGLSIWLDAWPKWPRIEPRPMWHGGPGPGTTGER